MKSIELEAFVRIVPFLSGLIIFSLIGFIKPFRKQKRKLSSYFSNIVLTFLNSFLAKLILPLSLGAWAIEVSSNGWGLFNFLGLNFYVNIILTVVLMDLVVYWQHRIFHLVPALWRLHRVHHTDIHFDTTTALRFHPLEILLSILIQGFFITLLGASFWGVLLFSSLLNFSAMFNHGNFALPRVVEKLLVSMIVTPDMHRVHHSVVKNETNSNYGFFLSIWDKVFSSYVEMPKSDPQTMDIGIEYFREEKNSRLDQLLIQPFRRSL